MPKKAEILLPWPRLGLDRSLAYKQQAPLTTPDCLNVRVHDVQEDRARGGSRPGSEKAFQQRLGTVGSEGPVNLLASVRTAPSQIGVQGPLSTATSWTDNFSVAPLQSVWDPLPGFALPTVQSPPHPYSGYAYSRRDAFVAVDTFKAMSLEVPVGLDPNFQHRASIRTTPFNGYDCAYQIWMLMNNTSPAPAVTSVRCRITLDEIPNTNTCQVTPLLTVTLNSTILYENTFTVTTQASTSKDFAVVYQPSNGTITFRWGTTILGTTDILSTGYIIPGYRTGFAMIGLSTNILVPQYTLVDYFTLLYNKTLTLDPEVVLAPNRNVLVTAADTILYLTDPADSTALIVSNHTNPSTTNVETVRPLLAVERGGRLFIADHGVDKVIGVNGQLNVAGTVLTDTTVNFTLAGIDINNDVLVLSPLHVKAIAGSGDNPTVPYFIPGGYKITAVTATTLTITKYQFPVACPGNCGAGSGDVTLITIPYRVTRAPKVFEPVARTLRVLWEGEENLNRNPTGDTARPLSVFTFRDISDNNLTKAAAGDFKGSVFIGCPIVARWNDRLVWAAPPDAPHTWLMSRQGNPYDYYLGYSSVDVGRPFGSQTSPGGVIGKPITAVIPHTDDYLVFGTLSEIWVMRGDPAQGGRLDNLSNTIGIVDRFAFCRGPLGETWFLSRDGFYLLSPGANQYPQSISRNRVPTELMSLDISTHNIHLQYNLLLRGVDIWLSPKIGGPGKHFFFDVVHSGFWPVQMTTEQDPWVSTQWDADMETERATLIGGRDGYIRKYSRTAGTDDGVAFDSFVLLGPILLGETDYHDGLLNELIVTLGEFSGDVNWFAFTGDNSEEAFRQYQSNSFFATARLVAGYNVTHRPRMRGHSAFVKLQGV